VANKNITQFPLDTRRTTSSSAAGVFVSKLLEQVGIVLAEESVFLGLLLVLEGGEEAPGSRAEDGNKFRSQNAWKHEKVGKKRSGRARITCEN
jgi:hypothetical protein